MGQSLGKILLGTSGWSYKDWVGRFYKTTRESKLKAYSKVFKTAEIDSTFYRFPTKGLVLGWLHYTPPDFIFAAKLPKQITHKNKLEAKAVENDVYKFCDLMRPLQLDGKLSCLLAQLPPSLKHNASLLEGFLAAFPHEFRLAVEFRHKSWLADDTWRILEHYSAAYTIVDEPLLSPLVKVTSEFAYVRWHGRGERPWYYYLYEPEELEPWVKRVGEVQKQSEKVYGYFNNHYHGYAVQNCLQFSEMIGELTEVQKEASDNIAKYLCEAKKAAEASIKQRGMTLVGYIPKEIRQMGFEELLDIFMDKGRLRRAKGISGKDIRIKQSKVSSIKASIRDYRLSVDTAKRVILHDCADWSRCAPAKQFCKHVGKVMMTIPRKKATEIMKQIAMEQERWEFKPYPS